MNYQSFEIKSYAMNHTYLWVMLWYEVTSGLLGQEAILNTQ
jgi:hypothetical protein